MYEQRFKQPAPPFFLHRRVQDLKHTFGRRLRAAGMAEERRKILFDLRTRALPATTR